MTWVIARNGRKRPMLVHRLDDANTDYTRCGVRLVGWNREYLRHRPTGPLAILACKRCSATR